MDAFLPAFLESTLLDLTIGLDFDAPSAFLFSGILGMNEGNLNFVLRIKLSHQPLPVLSASQFSLSSRGPELVETAPRRDPHHCRPPKECPDPTEDWLSPLRYTRNHEKDSGQCHPANNSSDNSRTEPCSHVEYRFPSIHVSNHSAKVCIDLRCHISQADNKVLRGCLLTPHEKDASRGTPSKESRGLLTPRMWNITPASPNRRRRHRNAQPSNCFTRSYSVVFPTAPA